MGEPAQPNVSAYVRMCVRMRMCMLASVLASVRAYGWVARCLGDSADGMGERIHTDR